MTEISHILNSADNLLTQCIKTLKELNPSNFDSQFNSTLRNYKKAKLLLKQIPAEDNSPEVKEKLKKINFSTKLIEKEYDNVIRKYYTEIDKIKSDISSINKKRKLASYSKGKL
jgi:uncharacterized protein Yka (UPF0111/DUF47 family)